MLFFIAIDDPSGPVRPVFYSTNLRGMPIPDVPGRRVFNTFMPGIGELRVGEFILSPRIGLTLLARFFNWRDALVVVRPETLIRWHRAGWKLFWRLKSRRGRPPIPLNCKR